MRGDKKIRAGKAIYKLYNRNETRFLNGARTYKYCYVTAACYIILCLCWLYSYFDYSLLPQTKIPMRDAELRSTPPLPPIENEEDVDD